MSDYQAYLDGRRQNPVELTVVRNNGCLVTFDEDADRVAQKLDLRTVRIGRYRELILSEGDLGRLNGATELVNVVQAD